ncbi:MAG: NUDIX hydrolase [Oligoflexales bacterium]
MPRIDHYSVRVILINDKNELLLMHAKDPSTTRTDGKYNGDFWFLIGGEQENGESVIQTAVRELWEETGLKEAEFKLGPIVWKGEFDLVLSGKERRMKQKFIVARTDDNSVCLNNLTESEKKVVKEIRWFSLDEIKQSEEIIYPVLLPEYLAPILSGIYPSEAIEVDIGRNPDEVIK